MSINKTVTKSFAKIERNDPCPCGSGEKYKFCCLNSNIKWIELGKTYDGKTSYDNYSLNEAVFNTLNEILKSLSGRETITKEEGLDLISRIYEVLTPALQQIQRNAPCKKGCNACCHIRVDVSDIEKEYILVSLNSQQKKLIKSNIKKNQKNEANRQELIRSGETKHTLIGKPCPFLDEEGACSIYETRPFACRKWFVLCDPAKCDDSTYIFQNGDVIIPALYGQDVKKVIELINQKVYGTMKYHILSDSIEKYMNESKKIFGIKNALRALIKVMKKGKS
jgi:Fe-S-cluster containining protein